MEYIIISISYLLGGLIFLLVSFLLNLSIKRRKKKYTECIDAKIVDIKREFYSFSTSSNGGFYYFEYYEYNYNNHNYIMKNTQFYTTKQRHKIGQIIKLYINPENPEEFYSKEDNYNLLIYIFSIVGISSLIVGLILIAMGFN